MGRKSAKIAMKKGAADKAKSLVYTKALHDVTSAVKSGGPDPDTNFLLKIALDRCKKFNVPKDNIDRAINKAQGGDGQGYKDISYEGYGPGGIAIFVEASTDNITRTAANIKNYFNHNGGSLGTNGSLQFIFDRKAVFTLSKQELNLNEDELTLELIDAGIEEVETDPDTPSMLRIIAPMEHFGDLQNKLQELEIQPEEASLQRIPLTFKQGVEESILEQFDKLLDTLENDDDVVAVYDNLKAD